VPEGWLIFPAVIQPNLQGNVLALAPDGVSAALFGYAKASGSIAQKAAETDEAMANPDIS